MPVRDVALHLDRLFSWLLGFSCDSGFLVFVWRTGWPLSFLAAWRFYDLWHFMQMSIKHSAPHTAEKKEGRWAVVAPHSKWMPIMLAGKWPAAGQLSLAFPETSWGHNSLLHTLVRIWKERCSLQWGGLAQGTWALASHPPGQPLLCSWTLLKVLLRIGL